MQLDNKSLRAMNKKEAASQARLVRMPARKSKLVRVLEALFSFMKPLIPSLRPLERSAELPRKILVVEYWNLGDLAILVPFLRDLRQSFPQARISLLLGPGLTCFLEGQGLVDEFIPVHVPWARHFHRWRKYNPFSLDWISLARSFLALRKRRFDWAFTGRMDVRDNFVLWLIGAQRRIGYGIGGGACFLTDNVMPDDSRAHRVDAWLHLLEAINVLPGHDLNGFRLNKADLCYTRSLLRDLGIPSHSLLIGVHPGAGNAVRRWGNDRFAEVARRVLSDTRVRVLWFSEPGDASATPLLEHCHKVNTDLRRFIAVLSHCRLLICNDSGPMHLANLLNVPVVAVFGPQRPEWFGPRGLRDRVVIHPEFSCRPCFDHCIFDQPYCLRAIATDEVYAAVQYQMDELREPHAHIPLIDTVDSTSYVS